MTQLGWLEWRLTDEALPDLFDMVDSAYPERSSVVELDELEEKIADPRAFAKELAEDIAVTLTGQFPSIRRATEATPPRPIDTSSFMRTLPPPRDSRSLIEQIGGETDSGEFARVPNTGISSRSLPRSTPDSVPRFELDGDIAAMFSQPSAARRLYTVEDLARTDEDVTVEVDLSDLQLEKRNRR
mgnify:CR=1 FL=1